MSNNRRNFIKNIGGSMALLAVGNAASASSTTSKATLLHSTIKVSANDKIRIGLIGSGII